jgi:hypothetical protein
MRRPLHAGIQLVLLGLMAYLLAAVILRVHVAGMIYVLASSSDLVHAYLLVLEATAYVGLYDPWSPGGGDVRLATRRLYFSVRATDVSRYR